MQQSVDEKGMLLTFLERGILENFTRLVGEKIPEARQIIVFGSRAKGDSDEESDLDVAIILEVSHVSKEAWGRIWSIKWKVLESLDAEEFPLSLTLITSEDLALKDYGIENAIKREGIVIWRKEN